MQYRPLGTSGLDASVVGLGTWAIGGWMWGGTEEKESIRAIHSALDAGINLVDTAPVYGFGRSEEIVGKAIQDRRDKVVLATKCGLVWNQNKGKLFFHSDEKHITRSGSVDVHRYLGPESIRHEVEQSLKRLQTDTIDVVQTHWQDPTTPIPETMEMLLQLKQEGKIRAIGASNATPEQLKTYLDSGELDVDQELYSMLDRKQETENLPFCSEKDIAFFAYSPLGQGLLTGKIGPERSFKEGDQRKDNPRFNVENREKIKQMLQQFEPIARAHNISLAQLAIAWTVSQTGCSHALVGARNPEQAQENANAGDVSLTADELDRMQSAIETFTTDIP
jgi:aryl-alcohol dehydrogenase-like predicted oxidoreductase